MVQNYSGETAAFRALLEGHYSGGGVAERAAADGGRQRGRVWQKQGNLGLVKTSFNGVKRA